MNNPPAFICHYYNHYFAHTAGGRMIGAKVSQVGCAATRAPPGFLLLLQRQRQVPQPGSLPAVSKHCPSRGGF